jgi:hypothetical protein
LESRSPELDPEVSPSPLLSLSLSPSPSSLPLHALPLLSPARARPSVAAHPALPPRRRSAGPSLPPAAALGPSPSLPGGAAPLRSPSLARARPMHGGGSAWPRRVSAPARPLRGRSPGAVRPRRGPGAASPAPGAQPRPRARGVPAFDVARIALAWPRASSFTPLTRSHVRKPTRALTISGL